jgi:SAM-dependent methyltransferase
MGTTAPALDRCPVCGAKEFIRQRILWPELIEEWKLSSEEVDYIDLQQGFCCANCKNNLRAMTLAAAITKTFGFEGSFKMFCSNNVRIRDSIVIEINAAGELSRFLKLLPKSKQYCFPEIDLQRMDFTTESIDVIIHSDTLEHVPDAKAALRESWRVLKRGGCLFYTIPIVVGRLTRSRHQLPPSYHGNPAMTRDDFRVQTEYGADFWCEVFETGFRDLRLTTLVFPASIAIAATKA